VILFWWLLFVVTLPTKHSYKGCTQAVTTGLLHQTETVVQALFVFMTRCKNMPSVSVKKLIAAIYQVKKSSLVIQLMNVDRQKIQEDCGLLAMAYATSLCVGQAPVNVVYDQEKLRQHFMDSLMSGKVKPFPVASNRIILKSVSVLVREKVDCICRQISVGSE
jgi:hypothetical protein